MGQESEAGNVQAAGGIGWNFDNSYARLPERFYARVNPTPVRAPRIVRVNHGLCKILGLDFERANSADGLAVFSGNHPPEGASPIAQAYAGHQFGGFVHSLGDGRAILLGEQVTPAGTRYDIQLKGSGVTPFSRRGDGRATLGAIIREYLIGEALYALGLPTTRTLALVATGESVQRETALPGAVQTRVAASHIRIGTFEYFMAREDADAIRMLADYVIDRHYPESRHQEHPYRHFAESFMDRQAALVARWMEIGFIHGVMNTDNMALSGESIDFGPCAFMNRYDPATVFSSIDRGGRYAFGAQPVITQWNLARFFETMLQLLADSPEQGIEIAQGLIESFPGRFQAFWYNNMFAKLGISRGEREGDRELVSDFLKLLLNRELDYTNSCRMLATGALAGVGSGDTEFSEWSRRWTERLAPELNGRLHEESLSAMKARNPSVIARNHLVEAAIRAGVENEDFSFMEKLLGALEKPFIDREWDDPLCIVPDGIDENYRTFCGT